MRGKLVIGSAVARVQLACGRCGCVCDVWSVELPPQIAAMILLTRTVGEYPADVAGAFMCDSCYHDTGETWHEPLKALPHPSPQQASPTSKD